LFLRVLTWLEGGQGIIFRIVANVRDPSCIKGLNLAGMAPNESFCQATPPFRYWERKWTLTGSQMGEGGGREREIERKREKERE
jgi:hypothetical protein